MDKKKVLDDGYVIFVDRMGDDAAVVDAARMSYEADAMNEKRSMPKDRGLLRYLMRHWHTSPSEMVELKVQIKLPLFVAAQLIRHRTASLNQLSARYTELNQGYYIPDLSRIQSQSKLNKQGSGDALSPEAQRNALDIIKGVTLHCDERYRDLLALDVSRELSRIVVPQNAYTMMVWKMDLHNLLHFLRLRLDHHAQWEIREYARVIGEHIKEWLPMTWEAFEDYRLKSLQLSRQEREAVSALLGELDLEDIRAAADAAGLKGREKREFCQKMRSLSDEEE